MSTIQELIKQNAITTETATFLRACLYAQLNIVIWSPSQDEANILANAR